jgi:hypothetical protein
MFHTYKLFQWVRDSAVKGLQNCRKPSTCFDPWRAVLSGALGALVVSTSAQASPLSFSAIAPAIPIAQVQVSPTLADGMYFMGSVPHVDALGEAYMVFEADGPSVVGAFFMPQSSFDCFQGTIENSELALSITNSYTQEAYTYEVALVSTGDAIASSSNPEVSFQLDGFFDLGAPRPAEQAILATCRANYISKNQI